MNKTRAQRYEDKCTMIRNQSRSDLDPQLTQILYHIAKVDPAWEPYLTKPELIEYRPTMRYLTKTSPKCVVSATLTVGPLSLHVAGELQAKRLLTSNLPYSRIRLLTTEINCGRDLTYSKRAGAAKQIVRIAAQRWQGKPRPSLENIVTLAFPLTKEDYTPVELLSHAKVSCHLKLIKDNPPRNLAVVSVENERARLVTTAIIEHGLDGIQCASRERLIIQHVELSNKPDFKPYHDEEQMIRGLVSAALKCSYMPEVDTNKGFLRLNATY